MQVVGLSPPRPSPPSLRMPTHSFTTGSQQVSCLPASNPVWHIKSGAPDYLHHPTASPWVSACSALSVSNFSVALIVYPCPTQNGHPASG
jgi:hypothetical protein